MIRAELLLLGFFLCTARVDGCYYGEHGFDPHDKSQTSAFELINERFAEEQERKMTWFRQQLKREEEDKENRSNDADWQDNYAYLLFRSGYNDRALAAWERLLKQDPQRFTTLCNLGTALHGMSRHEEALKYLKQAAALRPEFRGGAEKYHVQMIDYQHRQRKEPDYASRHLFVDDLTPYWKNRKTPPETFARVKEFPEHNEDGIAELLRQYPRFGDGWLVLGMVLENKGEHYLALRAYERAVKFGTAQREGLRSYLRSYSDFALSHDPPRSAARKLKWTFLLLAAGGILFMVLRFLRIVVLDLTSPDRKKAPLDPTRKDK